MRQSISRLHYLMFAQGDTSKNMLTSDGISIGVGFVGLTLLCAFSFTYLVSLIF